MKPRLYSASERRKAVLANRKVMRKYAKKAAKKQTIKSVTRMLMELRNDSDELLLALMHTAKGRTLIKSALKRLCDRSERELFF